MGVVKVTPQELSLTAVKYRELLIKMPIIGIDESIKHMTKRPGVRGKERVGEASINAQFAPYKANRQSDADLEVKVRELETQFGNVVTDFEPNSAVSTVLGLGATKGDDMKNTPTALAVLTLIADSLSEYLDTALFAAKRNPSGDTTMDLFDGFDTITEKEITAGEITKDKKNYMKLASEITVENAVDVFKDIMKALHPVLRRTKCYIYCSQDILDIYNESYKLQSGLVPYNQQYDQVAVEGSAGNLVFVPLASKAGSKYMQICAPSNMLVGYDTMSDVESVDVKEFKPFVLTYIATMFFGVQFESINARRLFVVELAD